VDGEELATGRGCTRGAVSVSLPLLTNSRAKAFRRCARFHQNSYILRYRPCQKAEALHFGSVFHLMLAAWWTANPELRLSSALDEVGLRELDEIDRILAEELILAYDARWSEEPLRTERVEVQFETALINPATGALSRTWRLGGKIDVIASRDGRPMIVEHKTTSEDIAPGSAYWRKLRIDSQVSTYFLGAQSIGFDVETCIYDVIRKPKLEPLKATPEASRKYTKQGALYANQRDRDETPEEFRARLREHIAENIEKLFQRGEVVRSEAELAEFNFDMWQTARMIREAEVAERHPRNPDACFQWSRACEYFDVCTGAASLTDESRFRKVEATNEELDSNPTEPAAAE
jgi:Holliday junction resolvase-like predicted endonuclease